MVCPKEEKGHDNQGLLWGKHRTPTLNIKGKRKNHLGSGLARILGKMLSAHWLWRFCRFYGIRVGQGFRSRRKGDVVGFRNEAFYLLLLILRGEDFRQDDEGDAAVRLQRSG